jgi:hypothetical protein
MNTEDSIENGQVTLSRDANSGFDYQDFRIIIDGEITGSIRCGSEWRFTLPPRDHEIYLEFDYKSFGTYRSKKVRFNLKPNEEIRYTCGVSFFMMYLLYFSKEIIFLKKTN